MKICIYLLFVILVMVLNGNAQEIFTPLVKPNNAFDSGEKLTYQIKYGFVVGGNTTLSLTEDVYDGEKVFHALMVGKTTGLANKIYGVKDIYESWFDKVSNLPLKSVRNISEGRYKNYNEVTYNRKDNTVTSKLSGVHQVTEKILDLSSTLYYLRRVDFSNVKEGNILSVNMFFSDEIYPFRLIYKGKETIMTKFGKINCLKLKPIVEVGRMFKTPDDLTIWFTNDDNCIPVLIRMNIRVVGVVNLKLIKYENIVNPLIIQE